MSDVVIMLGLCSIWLSLQAGCHVRDGGKPGEALPVFRLATVAAGLAFGMAVVNLAQGYL